MPKKKKKEESNTFKKSLQEELPSHLKGGLRKVVNEEVILSPPVDICENKNDYVLTFNMPGMKNKNVEVKVINNELYIEEKKGKKRTKKRNAILEEIEKGRYFRKFRLTSEINNEKISAVLEDGLLTVNLPKRKQEKEE